MLAVTPEPLDPPAQIDESVVWPGIEGFIATAVVAILAVLLIIDMARRVRRLTYRSEIRDRLEAEQRGTAAPHVPHEDAGLPVPAPGAETDAAANDAPASDGGDARR